MGGFFSARANKKRQEPKKHRPEMKRTARKDFAEASSCGKLILRVIGHDLLDEGGEVGPLLRLRLFLAPNLNTTVHDNKNLRTICCGVFSISSVKSPG